jgi:hypothetical protein
MADMSESPFRSPTMEPLNDPADGWIGWALGVVVALAIFGAGVAIGLAVV